MTYRRTFNNVVASVLLLWLFGAEGQEAGKLPRVGVLVPGSASSDTRARPIAAFEDGLRDRGWVEGTNLLIERRYAEERPERYPALAADLVRVRVDVIVPAGGPASLKAATDATKTIPIVMVASSRDPIAAGLIKSFARPGGNVTGLATASAELIGKQLEFLKAAIPVESRFGLLWDRTAGPFQPIKELDATARSLGAQLQVFDVRDPADFEGAVTNAVKAHVGGLIMVGSPMLVRYGREIADLLAKYRLPAVAIWRSQTEAGALMAYGPSITSEFRSAAIYVDKILKGANPAELPVEQPSKYELVINLRTAKALGLALPQSLLVRADEVIQ